MDIQKLREQLEIDEGVVHEIYNDHLGYPTFGIGHLITEDENDRVIEAFDKDVQSVLSDCSILYPNFESLPEEAQQIIANMMFNLGRPRLSKFRGMKAGVDDQNWERAADEMVDSRWYRQVGARAERLVERMRAIG